MAILKQGQILGVCVHHSVYTAAKNLAELKEHAKLYNTWHKNKSWAETTKTTGDYPYISYHYLIALDGALLKVTDEKYVKYHAGDNFRGDLSFNLHGIAVCIDGNYENDKPNDAQMLTLVKLIRDIEKRYDINARVRGHKETSETPTACPGKNIGTSTSGWLKTAIANVNNQDYPSVEIPCAECVETDKQISVLNSKVLELQGSIKSRDQKIIDQKEELEALERVHGEELLAWEDKYNLLKQDMMRINTDKGKIQLELDQLKQSRFWWVAQWLDKIVPNKSE